MRALGYAPPIQRLTQSSDLFHEVGISTPLLGVFLAHYTEEGLDSERQGVP